MFKKFEKHVQSTLMELEYCDLKHCMKMAKHFEQLGLNPKMSGNALKSLAENGIVEKLYQQA